MASMNMALGAVRVLSELSNGESIFHEQILVMDGVNVGFLRRRKNCLFVKEYEMGNEPEFDGRDTTHMQQGSNFQDTVMIHVKKHRGTLSRLVKASNLKTSSLVKSYSVSKVECDGLLGWAAQFRPCLLPYLKVGSAVFA